MNCKFSNRLLQFFELTSKQINMLRLVIKNYGHFNYNKVKSFYFRLKVALRPSTPLMTFLGAIKVHERLRHSLSTASLFRL